MPEPDSIDRMQRSDHDTLIRVEGKVDGLSETIRTAVSELTGRVGDHETRLRVVEAQLSNTRASMRAYATAAGIGGAVAGFLLSAWSSLSGFIHK
jgi:hypothetical protein